MQSSLGNNPCGWICPDAEPSALIGHSQPSLSLNPHSAPTSGNTCTQEGDPLQSLGGLLLTAFKERSVLAKSETDGGGTLGRAKRGEGGHSATPSCLVPACLAQNKPICG